MNICKVGLSRLGAKDKSFNASFGEADFDPKLSKIHVVPQDIGRVLLNLINNAFYAVDKKAKEDIDGYKPEVHVTTKTTPLHGGVGGGSPSIQIIISDNGPGIPDTHQRQNLSTILYNQTNRTRNRAWMYR
ncbi:MAG: hypothetical protein U5K79_16510 [Cyclobacteriaceae bacterium]|nr:hypothetical protein [Cyclobacteriaceae bacterium]